MTHTFKVQTTQFTIQVPKSTWDQSSETRLQNRITDIKCACAKKPRKPAISAGKRNFPKSYIPMSTHDYVHEYYRLNASSAGTKHYNGSPAFGSYDKHAIDAFFQPLSTRITPVDGEDSYAVDD